MKNWIAKNIYKLMYWIDTKRNKISHYSYETAPYCGHYYNGHNGWLTSSHYHEGMGGEIGQIGWFKFMSDSEAPSEWSILVQPPKPVVIWTTVIIPKPLVVREITFHGFIAFCPSYGKRFWSINKARTVFHILGCRFERRIEIKKTSELL